MKMSFIHAQNPHHVASEALKSGACSVWSKVGRDSYSFRCRGLSTDLVSVEGLDEEDFTHAQDPSHVVATATKGPCSINGLNLDETAQPRSHYGLLRRPHFRSDSR
jgi:hypothetical protein